MALSRADVVLHPVRLRIVRSLLGSERRTASELTRLLPDVPQASLYRHLSALVDGNVLRVVADRPGTTTASTTGDTAGGRSRVGARRGYTLAGSAPGAGHREATVYLDDAEFDEFTRSLSELIDAAVACTPRPGRKRRLLATVAVPLDVTTDRTVPRSGTTDRTES